MNLIISLLGQKHHDLFDQKFIHNLKKNNDSFLLNEILEKFSFCKKIFIICNNDKKYIKNINLKKKSKIKLIHSNKTTNQIKSILKVKNFIKNNEKLIILNPDSLFDITPKDFNNNLDGIIFNIAKNDIGRNFENKDTLYLDKKNKIIKIKKKSKDLKEKIVSAGLYCFKNISFLVEGCSKIKNINKKGLHVADIFLKLIKHNNIGTKSVRKFVCFADKKKIDEYKFWKKYFKINHKVRDKLNTYDIQNIIPSAGEGSRHKHLGYNLPKPLIPISNKRMFERSLESLPNKKNNLFIFKKNTFINNNLKKKFPKSNQKSFVHLIEKKTKGMAITISKARKFIQ
jgi:NDP-sugar pyrophosphorylase family protein